MTNNKERKNPYVHPSKDGVYLNQFGNDGYSFEEKNESEEDIEMEEIKE